MIRKPDGGQLRVTKTAINRLNVDQKQAREFVENNKTIIVNNGSSCIDGRQLLDEASPMLTKPGADAGDLMIALAAFNALQVSIDPQIVKQAVLNVVGGVSNFHFHTDENHPLPGSGCAHVNKAINKTEGNPESRGLTWEQAEFIGYTLAELLKAGAQQTVLTGAHQEQAVISVVSDRFGLKPQWLSKGKNVQAFVYHQSGDLDRRHRLCDELIVLLGDSAPNRVQLARALQSAAELQLQQTVLAVARDLPKFVTTIDDNGRVTVT